MPKASLHDIVTVFMVETHEESVVARALAFLPQYNFKVCREGEEAQHDKIAAVVSGVAILRKLMPRGLDARFYATLLAHCVRFVKTVQTLIKVPGHALKQDGVFFSPDTELTVGQISCVPAKAGLNVVGLLSMPVRITAGSHTGNAFPISALTCSNNNNSDNNSSSSNHALSLIHI